MMSKLITIVSLMSIQKDAVGFTMIAPRTTTIRAETLTRSITNPGFSYETTLALRSSPSPVDNSKEEEDEDGLDLNLEEMFTMFDAADKGQDFDEAIGQVKQ